MGHDQDVMDARERSGDLDCTTRGNLDETSEGAKAKEDQEVGQGGKSHKGSYKIVPQESPRC